jgi:diacylglycerol kinase (ATP)
MNEWTTPVSSTTAELQPNDRTYVFIINPQAGHRTGRRIADQIQKTFRDQGMERFCEIEMTDRSGHASDLAKAHGLRLGDRGIIFACGGDGTVHETVNGIYGTGAALGVIPTGTANDFSRQVLSTTNIPELLSRLTTPVIRPIDLFSINDRVCINIASFGLDTKVQMKAESITRRFHFLGGLVYPISVLLSLFGGREFGMSYELMISDENGSIHREIGSSRFVLSAICNGGYYGGGYHPAPDASPTDGLLDICIVDNVPLSEIIKLLPRYKAGTHRGHPAVHFFRAQEGVIRATEGELLGNYDGEIFQSAAIQFKVLPGAVPFAFY